MPGWGAALARLLAVERERWALWLPVCLGAGIAVYFVSAAEPPQWAGAAAMTATLAAAYLFRRRPAALIVAIAVAVAATGFTAAQLRTAVVSAPVLEKRIGPLEVIGRVVSLERRVDGFRIVLDRVRAARIAPAKTPERVRVKTRSIPPQLRPGDTIAVRAVLAPPPLPAAPGAFDFARRAYFQRLGAVGFAFGGPRIVERAPGSGGWRIAIARLRDRLTARVLAALESPAGPVAAALMTGQRGMIPKPVLAAMRDAGLAHLLAISGLHIGLVAGIVFFALRLLLAAIEPLALRQPVKKWAALGALAGGFAYLLISGGTVPTQRAFLMLAVVLTAVLFDRTAISMRLVALAATLVLLRAPESLLSASFQLSFAAVVALVAAYEGLSPALGAWRADGGRRRRAMVYLATVAISTLVAGLATAPFAAFHFNRIALYSIAANLIAIPMAGLWIMPLAVVAFALMPFGLEALALTPMGWGIDAVIAVAEGVAAWPGAVALVSAMPTAALGVVAIGGLWLCLWRGGWRYLGLAAVAAALASLVAIRPPDILIGGRGRLMAVRTDDGGLALSTMRSARFEGKIWLRRAGLAAAAPWPKEGYGADGRLACDGLGCILRRGPHTVALVRQAAALAEDCRLATAIVSIVPVRRYRCRGPTPVIDRFDLWRRGGHALWLENGGVRVESVAERRGRRPWTRDRARRR